MNHIEVVKKTIEFKNPRYLPLEVIEVPGIFDDYGKEGIESTKLLEGAEDFDSLQATYSWTFEDLGKDKEGNLLRRDEWGCIQKVPQSGEYSYLVIEEPLRDLSKLPAYTFPDPAITDGFFIQMKKNLQPYKDRFIAAYLDPGSVLIMINLLGAEGFFSQLYLDKKKVLYLFDGIWEFQKVLIKKWKEIGAQMIFLFDEWASQSGLLINPEFWRQVFKPFYKKIFSYIHAQGMYTGLGLDGNVLEILPDLKEVGMDAVDVRQPRAMGFENLAKVCDGKLCLKVSVDMQRTLPSGSVEEVKREADEIVRYLAKPEGGLIALVYRWATLKLPEENVRASVKAFNEYRRR